MEGSQIEVRETIKESEKNSLEDWAEDGDSWSDLDGGEEKEADGKSSNSAGAGSDRKKRGRPAKERELARDIKNGGMKGAMEKYIMGFRTSREMTRTPVKKVNETNSDEKRKNGENREGEGETKKLDNADKKKEDETEEKKKNNGNETKEKQNKEKNDDEMREEWWENKMEQMERIIQRSHEEMLESIYKKLSKETECRCKCLEVREEEEKKRRRELEACRQGIEKREKALAEKEVEIERLTDVLKIEIETNNQLLKELRRRKKNRGMEENDIDEEEDGETKARNEKKKGEKEKEKEIEKLMREERTRVERRKEGQRKEVWKKEEREKIEKEKPKKLNEKEIEEETEERKRIRMNLYVQYGATEYRNWEEVMMEIENRMKRRILKKRTTLIRAGQIRIECNSMREKKEIMENRRIMKGTGIWIMEEKTRRERDVELWIRKIAKLEQCSGMEVEIDEKSLKLGDKWWRWNEKKGELED